MQTAQVIIGIVMIPYILIGVALLYLMSDRVNCSSVFYYTGDPEDSKPIDQLNYIGVKPTVNPRVDVTTANPIQGSGSLRLSPYASTEHPNGSQPMNMTNLPRNTTLRKVGKAPPTYSTRNNHTSKDAKNSTDAKKPSPQSQTAALAEFLPIPQKSFMDRYCTNPLHGMLCTASTMLMGITIIIYRLLAGMKTRIIKYVHMILHLVALLIMCVGIWQAFVHDYSPSYSHLETHNITSWVIFVLLILQMLVGIILFTYLYPHTDFRLIVAPYHDLIGIWLFVCLVGCCISGKRSLAIDYSDTNLFLHYGLCSLGFMIILVIVFSPYFEWELEGPI